MPIYAPFCFHTTLTHSFQARAAAAHCTEESSNQQNQNAPWFQKKSVQAKKKNVANKKQKKSACIKSKYERKTIDTKSKKLWLFATRQATTDYLKFLKEKKK